MMMSADDKREDSFQERVLPWIHHCFRAEASGDKLEQGDRFLEEALELIQTISGFDVSRVHKVVDYVFSRPAGDLKQEVGGVMPLSPIYA